VSKVGPHPEPLLGPVSRTQNNKSEWNERRSEVKAPFTSVSFLNRHSIEKDEEGGG
jgi:hypothetical protein